MKIAIVGSGTGVPSIERGSPCLLLRVGDENILFDLGPGALRQLLRIGVPHQKIDRVFFTHFHPDHTADLVHLLFATKNPVVLKSRRPFQLCGGEGFVEFLTGLQNAYGKWLRLPDDLVEVDELEITKPDRRDLEGARILSQPLKHTPNSLAYRVEEDSGAGFVYSGDTGYSEELVEFSMYAELLILECSFPEESRTEKHLTPILAGRIAAQARVKKLVLVHLYPEVMEEDISGQVRRGYDGELIIGRDLLELQIGD